MRRKSNSPMRSLSDFFNTRDGLEVNTLRTGTNTSCFKWRISDFDSDNVYIRVAGDRRYNRQVGILLAARLVNGYKNINVNFQKQLLNQRD